MKNYISLLLIFALTCTSSSIDAKTNQNNEYSIQVTKETITHYQKTIDAFLAKRRRQTKMINSSFGGFFASAFAGVNVKEARAFLNRAFEDEDALKKALANLPHDTESLEYLQLVMNQLGSQNIRRKNSKPLPEIMRTHKHPQFKGSEAPWEKSAVDDESFCKGAACSFMAYHLVESDGPARIKK